MLRKLLFAIIAVGVLSVTASLGVARATSMQSGDMVDVPKDKTVNSSVYAAGGSVTIAGTVKGDVYCAGQSVIVSGKVEGDVLCAGQDVRVTGSVDGDVRLAGQTVGVTGNVKQSATLMGQSITLEEDATIGRDLTVTGQNILLDGTVARDVVGAGGIVTLAGSIGRDVTLTSDTTKLQSDAELGGALTYTSKNEASIDRGATIAGKTIHQQPTEQKQADQSGMSVMGSLYWFFAIFATGLIFWLLVPKWLRETSDSQQKHALLSLGLGLGSLILTPILAFLLTLTLFGIPLGLFLVAAWFFALFASVVISAYTSGLWVMRSLGREGKGYEVLGLFLASVALVVLMSLPLIGGLIGLLVLLWGLGGITLGVYRTLRRQHTTSKA